MSRHVIPNAPGSPDNRVTTVGWDAPLNTFFAMAFDGVTDDPEVGDEEEVFWFGCMPGEIPTLEALDAALKKHDVALPFPIAAMLAMDKSNEGDRSHRPGKAIIDAMLAQKGDES